jgi:hypothetical protein
MSTREMIENALKRVNALLEPKTKGRLYHDNTGWYVIWQEHEFDEAAREFTDMLAYLHGIEDTLKFIKGKEL